MKKFSNLTIHTCIYKTYTRKNQRTNENWEKIYVTYIIERFTIPNTEELFDIEWETVVLF